MKEVEDYIEQINNSPQKELFRYSHSLLSGIAPGIRCQIKYKIPFYRQIKDICYLNPYKDYLYIGFTKGALLADRKILQKNGKKTIAKLYITDLDLLLSDEVSEIILEAILLDKELHSKNRN